MYPFKDYKIILENSLYISLSLLGEKPWATIFVFQTIFWSINLENILIENSGWFCAGIPRKYANIPKNVVFHITDNINNIQNKKNIKILPA